MNDVKYLGEDGRFAWPVLFDAANIAVSIIDEYGRERLLSENVDYIFREGNVLCPCPAGSLLHIWPSAKKAAPAPTPAPVDVPGPARAPRTALSPASVSPDPQESSAPARVYEDAETAANRRIDKALQSMDETIAEYESRLASASLRAEKMALDAGDSASARLSRDASQIKAQCEAILHKCFLEAARASSWAVQISQYHRRPGVSTVKSEAEIPGSSRGLILVNPHITHSPTPFMGVWPVRDLREAQWEGLFFFGHPYDGEIATPPPFPVCPPLPPEPASGDGDDWIPCEHPHLPKRPPHRGHRPPCAPPCDCEAPASPATGQASAGSSALSSR